MQDVVRQEELADKGMKRAQ